MRHILIVDHNDDIRGVYKKYLESEGFRVSESADGLDALLRFTNDTVDAILLEVDLKGPRAWVSVDSLTAFYPKSKIIVFSCYPHEIQRNLIGDAAGYHDKAAGCKDLVKKLNKLFGGSACVMS